ncbi:guanine nucleotide-binding protein subunit beta-like protein 1 [Venturia canescens]|uniref:guanine nucleotide-binding protein subunit beta-like protein 1 n=1 Tax=Venturia canescens TaxID=32260 RepID=UPI001C9BE45A|nr:guanine nucleotide-binding protein subunit beta-like protein 1 [Venturia canescens]XP_043279014.1 guanine nucleotide-binding protein subunit beta-like protein 1 [Venturia canescens]
MAILPPDPIYILRGNNGPVHSLTFKITPYIEHLYAGTENGDIHIWDLKKNREALKLEDKKDPCLSLSVNDERLVAQRKGGAIDIWSADGSHWTLDQTTETTYCGFCRFQHQDHDLVLVPLKNSVIGALSLKSLDIVYELDSSLFEDQPKLGQVMAIKPINCFERNYVLASYESGHTGLWDLRERRVVGWLKINECPMAINFDDYWMRGVIGSPSDKLEIFEMSKVQALALSRQITIKNPGTSVIGSRSDSKVFAVGGWDGRLRIFSWKSLRPLVVLDQHKGSIHDIAYYHGKIEAYNSKGLMAAAGKDGTISLWDIYNQ